MAEPTNPETETTNPLMKASGLGAVSGFLSYLGARQRYENQKRVSEFKNTINSYNFTNTLLSIELSREQAVSEYMNTTLVNQQQGAAARGALAVNAAFTGTSGNTQQVLTNVVDRAEATRNVAATETLRINQQQFAMNRASAYLNKVGSFAITPAKPSLSQHVVSGVVSSASQAAV